MTANSKNLTPRISKRFVLWSGLAAAAFCLSSLSAFARDHALMINVSPSLPYWAIWLERGVMPARGEIIVFDPPPSALLEAHFGKEPKPFAKKVLGVAGDRVTQNARTYFINGKPVAKAKPHSRNGEKLALGPTGTIPMGCYYVGTDHVDGFDSRYAAIGWICRPRVLGVGRPIL